MRSSIDQHFRRLQFNLRAEIDRRARDPMISNFKEFCGRAMPSVRWVRAREEMANALQGLHDGTLCDGDGRRIDRLMIRAPAQLGKALDIQTPILTTDGWSTVGALRVGDSVFDIDGTPTLVIGKGPVLKDRACFCITTQDNKRIIADWDHEWVILNCQSGMPEVRETWRLYEDGDDFILPVHRYPGNTFFEANRKVSIRFHGFANTQCISVASASQQYLAGDCLIPTHNSSIVQLFAAWWLYQYPALTAACSTYDDEKAREFSYMVREYYRNAGGEVRHDSSAVRRWHTKGGGGFWARSVDSGAAGNPANLLIEDDLDKDLAHALQPKHRKMVRDVWYAPVWLNRWAAEHGRLLEINIGTPHDLEDSQNYILNSPGVGEENASRKFFLLPLQAIYDRVNYPIEAPEGTIVARDWRQHGEPIAQELSKFTSGAIETFRHTMSGAAFAAMMQCTPVSSGGGGILDPRWFVPVDEDPGLKVSDRQAYSRQVRFWDLGHTEGGGDLTVGIKQGLVQATNRVLIRHCATGQKAAGGVKRLIAAMSLLDGPQCDVGIADDPAAGKSWSSDIIQYLREVWAWCNVPAAKIHLEKPKGSKLSRSERIISKAQPPRTDADVSEDNCGTVNIYTGTWKPILKESVKYFDQAVREAHDAMNRGVIDADRRYRELTAIAEIAHAMFFDENKASSLNISNTKWVDPLLYEAKMFDGLPGHKDDHVDSLGDGLEYLVGAYRRQGGASMSVPGW